MMIGGAKGVRIAKRYGSVIRLPRCKDRLRWEIVPRLPVAVERKRDFDVKRYIIIL